MNRLLLITIGSATSLLISSCSTVVPPERWRPLNGHPGTGDPPDIRANLTK